MASSYVVPQLRVFQQFAEAAPSGLASMTACMVGPNYKVVTPDDSSSAVGRYSPAGATFFYPGLDGTDRILPEDTDSFQAVLKDADIELLNYGGTEDTDGGVTPTKAYLEEGGNWIVTGGVIANSSHNPYPLPDAVSIGDAFYVGGDRYSITGFLPGEVKEDQFFLIDKTNSAGVTFATLAPTNEVETDFNKYRVEVVAGFTAGSSVTTTFVAYAGNLLKDEVSVSAGDTAAVDFTKIGIRLIFSPGGVWKAGDSVTLVSVSASTTALTTAVLDRDVVSDEGNIVLVKRLPSQDVEAAFTTTTITLAPSLKIGGKDILGAEVRLSFRALRTHNVGRVGTASSASDAESALGRGTPDNPLGLMVRKALQNSNGAPVSYLPTAGNSLADYEEALTRLEDDQVSYSIVPFSGDAEVGNALQAAINEMAGATRMNWKIGWLSYDYPEHEEVLTATNIILGSTTATIPLAGKTVTDVRSGDTITLTSDSETVVGQVSTVNPVNSSVVLYSSVPAGTWDVVITHHYTAAEKTANIAAYASTMDDPRIRLVIGNRVMANEVVDRSLNSGAYLAAAVAGLRSASAPHQPLTRVELVGFRENSDASAFNSSDMDEMAGKGTWIVTLDQQGNIFTRHQLTTCVSNYKLREDSKVTNADEISRYYRDELDQYYGRANVSAEFLELIRLKLTTIHQKILGRGWGDFLGPQITEVLETTVDVDPDLSDRVIVRDSLATPDPLNNLDVYLTIS